MCARYVCKSAEHKINLWLPWPSCFPSPISAVSQSGPWPGSVASITRADQAYQTLRL